MIITKAITKNKGILTEKILKKKLTVTERITKNKKMLKKKILKKKWIKTKKISRTKRIQKREKFKSNLECRKLAANDLAMVKTDAIQTLWGKFSIILYL